MKRIQAACICQTIHFTPKESISHSLALKLVKREFENYKLILERNGTKYKILEKNDLPDGSIIIKVMREDNIHPIGKYLDENETPPRKGE